MSEMFDDGLARARPAEKAVDAAAIQAFLDDAQRLGAELNSLMVWRNGAVVAEGWWRPYRPELPHMMHSATKSFLSAGVGLALAEGRFGLTDRVLDFFPDKRPAIVSDNLATMTVEDLLTQTSGHGQGASGSIWRAIRTSWIDEFFKIPVVFRPGEHFRYTSATSFMLSAIISRTTGQTAHAYLTPRLLQPLGIEGLSWDLGPEDINPGGNGISCRTSDLLKLAVLHLQGGVWRGVQVLPEAWVRAATTPKRGNPHGYHWWMGPAGAFYAYGVFGQFAVAFPEANAAVAITGAAPSGEETLRSLIWRHFPRAFAGEGVDGGNDPALAARLESLDLRPPLSSAVSGGVADLTGRWLTAAPNVDGIERLRLDLEGEHCVLTLVEARGVHKVTAGLGAWRDGATTLPGAELHHGYEPGAMKVVAGAQWRDARTLELVCQFVETAFRDTLVFRAEGDRLTFDRRVNVNSKPVWRPTIVLQSASSQSE